MTFGTFGHAKVREKKNYIFNKNILKNFPVFITENNINNINNEI